MFATNKMLRAEIKRLNDRIDDRDRNARTAWNLYHESVKKNEVLAVRAEIAERRAKELEAEIKVTMQAISGIGPHLLAAMGKCAHMRRVGEATGMGHVTHEQCVDCGADLTPGKRADEVKP